MHAKKHARVVSILAALMLGLASVPQAMAQERSGQITSVHVEAHMISINGREYFFSPEAELVYARKDTTESLGRLTPGTNVRYRVSHAGDRQQPHIIHLIVLD